MIKPILIFMLLFALVAPCVVAVNVSFDNVACGVHVVKDIPTNGFGVAITYDDLKSAVNGTACAENASVIFVTTSGYVTKPISYNVDEPITYPQEYYNLKTKEQDILDGSGFIGYDGNAAKYAAAISFELRRQTILMERNNELLQEQVNLLKAQKDAKLKCKTTEYRGACMEYAWVGGAS